MSEAVAGGTDPGPLRRRIVGALIYPALLGLAYGLFHALGSQGVPGGAAAYLSVAAAIAGLVLYEQLQPARPDWRPDRTELANDLLFLLLVQILLPFGLTLLVLEALVLLADRWEVAQAGLWPHHAAPWAQAGLMLILAEFPRYWLHRLSHHWAPLWRFHAVHHAPPRLYALNVGRFHPVDKSLQFLADGLPFLLLGVSAEVLHFYFVFYAVTGFVQHSSGQILLGPLNWIIAGPELHRWHHSADPREGRCNFGNKLIVWDLLFGTRFLPAGRQVGRLGIEDRHFPTDFLGQMAAPLRRGEEKS